MFPSQIIIHSSNKQGRNFIEGWGMGATAPPTNIKKKQIYLLRIFRYFIRNSVNFICPTPQNLRYNIQNLHLIY
jgi:hypothetical protein